MSVQAILASRHSVRGFKPEPVDAALLRRVFSLAQQAPSNCNAQPWQVYVASGSAREQLSRELQALIVGGARPEPKFGWLAKYEGIHRKRQIGSAVALYGAMGISRDDKLERQQAFLRNWDFFGAPHVAFFTMPLNMREMGAVDLGIYAETLALLLEEHGIQSCMQGALGQFPEPVEAFFDVREDWGVLFGMSIGYADPDHPANQARTDRADVSDAVVFRD